MTRFLSATTTTMTMTREENVREQSGGQADRRLLRKSSEFAFILVYISASNDETSQRM